MKITDPTGILRSKQYITDKHRISGRSIPKKVLTSGTISEDVACMIIDGVNAAIFNYSIPYSRYYVSGVETDVVLFSKGDTFVDVDYYAEGKEHTFQELMFKIS